MQDDLSACIDLGQSFSVAHQGYSKNLVRILHSYLDTLCRPFTDTNKTQIIVK